MTPAHHLDACVSPRIVRETAVQPTTPGGAADHPVACISPRKSRETGRLPITPVERSFATSEVNAPSRRECLRFHGARIVAALLSGVLVITFSTAARAVNCAPTDEACILAVEVHELTAERDTERARVARVTAELTACRATQGACQPLPPPEPYPWRDVVTAFTGGVAVGVVAWAVVSLALSR